MGRAWFAICKLEAARLASLFREKRYRGIIINLYEMRMKSCRRTRLRREQQGNSAGSSVWRRSRDQDQMRR